MDKKLDPHREREEKKYAHPIPSREFILETFTQQGVPLSIEELARCLRLKKLTERQALERRLSAMVRDGQLIRNRKQAFCLVNKKDLIAGRVLGYSDGFGFVRPDAGGGDLYLSPQEMKVLFHGDRVVVRIGGRNQRGNLEAAVVEILERKVKTIVGRLYLESGIGFVLPEQRRITHEIIIPSDRLAGAQQGQIVVAEITDQPTKRTQPLGKIIEILGDHLAPGMETAIAMRTHEISLNWPAEVLTEISKISEQIQEDNLSNRVDLRKISLITIDGEDARDFDDAVYCERTSKGWKLLVCVADVAHYVQPDTALDREAQVRGNSVYFPDRVIPMLPELLSNNLCSLQVGVDRLCLTAEIYLDQTGKILRSRFFPAVMNSHARLTYEQVAELLIDSNQILDEKFNVILPHLKNLYQLSQILRAARETRGALDFTSIETKFLFNEQGRVSAIIPQPRTDAHRLIEECMLVANIAAARLLQRKHIPAIYRIHEAPNEQKLNDLREFLKKLSLKLSGGAQPTTLEYAQLLDQVKKRPDGQLIQTILLRSMQQAVYSSDNAGHFGLACAAYTHFTSPIRRYPDLIVHRLIYHLLNGGTAQDLVYSKINLQQISEHCSGTERRADEATRDAEDWLKCEFMQHHLGEQYLGTIVSVNSFGLFVSIDEFYIDGLVHITALANDYYHFDPIGHLLHGERTGTIYRLGDRVQVQVAAVNLDERKIDLILTSLLKNQQKPAGVTTSKSSSRKKKRQRP